MKFNLIDEYNTFSLKWIVARRVSQSNTTS